MKRKDKIDNTLQAPRSRCTVKLKWYIKRKIIILIKYVTLQTLLQLCGEHYRSVQRAGVRVIDKDFAFLVSFLSRVKFLRSEIRNEEVGKHAHACALAHAHPRLAHTHTYAHEVVV